MVQLAFPDMAGGANKCCVIEGQQSFAAFGACEQRFKESVRSATDDDSRDPEWRPLDTAHDRFLKWGNREDSDLWQSVKNRGNLCLCYWLPDYWLRDEHR